MDKPASHGSTGPSPSTTFVQADTNTFREVVQRLTGPPLERHQHQTSAAPPLPAEAASEGGASKVVGIKRPTYKLHERRQYTRTKLEIIKPTFPFKSSPLVSPPSRPSFHSRHSSLLTSPVGTPSRTFSSLSIAEGEESREKQSFSELNSEEEEKAIKERRFYLHPSPRTRRRHSEPELLALFPLTSPKESDETS